MEDQKISGASLKEKIASIAGRIHGNVVANRRHLHANPELSFKEHETASFVAARLNELGIKFQTIAGTGLLASIAGAKPSGAVVALRADMDALPITESNVLEYASKNEGVMHACGHDAHTASLLGTAEILNELKNEFGGTVKFIFQPAEEKSPGGASRMIEEGALKDPAPAAVIGQHVMPSLAAGKVGFCGGRYMASNDEIYITVHGKGGHGAQPHENIDPVLVACHIVVALQQIVSRAADPRHPSVLSFGKISAAGSVNVIPDKVYMEGTFRTMDGSWRERAHEQLKKMAEGIAAAMGATCDLSIVRGYPVLVNDEALTEQVQGFAADYLGKENVVDLDIWMASEDFAYYSREAASCFYRLGTGNARLGITSELHTPTFNIDEDALQLSTGLMAYIALKQLGN